eukprot:m.168918 g.168918  ORF g.168918 m.168918 type:complete len:319 (-) comp24140_c0_seq1:190-1146(-)
MCVSLTTAMTRFISSSSPKSSLYPCSNSRCSPGDMDMSAASGVASSRCKIESIRWLRPYPSIEPLALDPPELRLTTEPLVAASAVDRWCWIVICSTLITASLRLFSLSSNAFSRWVFDFTPRLSFCHLVHTGYLASRSLHFASTAALSDASTGGAGRVAAVAVEAAPAESPSAESDATSNWSFCFGARRTGDSAVALRDRRGAGCGVPLFGRCFTRRRLPAPPTTGTDLLPWTTLAFIGPAWLGLLTGTAPSGFLVASAGCAAPGNGSVLLFFPPGVALRASNLFRAVASSLLPRPTRNQPFRFCTGVPVFIASIAQI